MVNIFLVFALTGASAALCWSISRKMVRRTEALERGLGHISDAISQLADFQMKTHQRSSVHFEDIEERLMELSVPSQDSSLPLERRHQVVALARQGVSIEEIGKRLKAPVGEAELILNLRKYMGGEGSPAGKIRGQAAQHG